MTHALHRVREVMRREEVSDRTLGRHLGLTIPEARAISVSSYDLPISQLCQIAKCLGCPPAELLIDSATDELIQLRALVLRLARITNTLLERSPNAAIRSLAESQRNQIIEVMPAVEHQSGLLAVSQRRSEGEYGRCVEHMIHCDDWGRDLSGEVLSQ